MYRYSVDNAVTYTSEDFVLFRESPFACWMERLTLENPDHGIPPDVGSVEPQNTMERQDDIVDTLRSEGRDVTLIEWDLAESRRRTGTLEAMRRGADFIVNGQLALGPLSGSANLLMRTSGYSELGDYLYVPCDTQAKTTLHSAFRLCFLVDLLHSLQGQLPPQMLIIRGGSDVVPLQAEDHIYHYRAVKQRFMEAMRNFRKHRMPDPAESSHFGRWSDCAHEVLKQRALRAEQQGVETLDEDFEIPLQQAVGAAGASASPYDLDDIGRPGPKPTGPDRALHDQPGAGLAPQAVTTPLVARGQSAGHYPMAGKVEAGAIPAVASPTLAEQARMLTPDTYLAGLSAAGPGSTPNLAEANRAAGLAEQTGHPQHNRRSSDVALQNLQFIGSSRSAPSIGMEPAFTSEDASTASGAPAPDVAPSFTSPAVDRLPPADTFAAPDTLPPMEPQVTGSLPEQVKPHPLDSVGFSISERSAVDLDTAPAPSLNPESVNPPSGFDVDSIDDSDFGEANLPPQRPGEANESGMATRKASFSDSLITSGDYED
jgi:hypothetical protein